MYIPYRKAYLTGMNPLSFITFFTVGELIMMIALALSYRGGTVLWKELMGARDVLFWLMFGGFVLGYRRPLPAIRDQVRGHQPRHSALEYKPALGSSLGNSGVPRIAWWRSNALHAGNRRFAPDGAGRRRHCSLSATEREHSSWRNAADREGQRYGVHDEYVRAGIEGRSFGNTSNSRTLLDWILIIGTTALFVGLALMARIPQVDINSGWRWVLPPPCLFWWQLAERHYGVQPDSGDTLAVSRLSSLFALDVFSARYRRLRDRIPRRSYATPVHNALPCHHNGSRSSCLCSNQPLQRRYSRRHGLPF